jgi:hypothetical protein
MGWQAFTAVVFAFTASASACLLAAGLHCLTGVILASRRWPLSSLHQAGWMLNSTTNAPQLFWPHFGEVCWPQLGESMFAHNP